MATTLLETVKKALRITHSGLDEAEITPLIEAAKKELEVAGVTNVDEGDPLIIRAVTVYCKANFGYDNPDSEKFQNAFNSLKNTISQVGVYNGEVEDVITLIKTVPPTEATNENGFAGLPTEQSRSVFCNKKSVGYSEFYRSQQAGYKAELKVDLYLQDYEKEALVEFEGMRYKVLRTYESRNGRVYRIDFIGSI